MSSFAQDSKTPATWEKDLVITLHYKGSRSGFAKDITFTFESCEYKDEKSKKNPKVYKLTDKDRSTILKKLRDLKFDQIKSQTGIHIVRDGWHQSLCVGTFCVEGGPSSEMSDSDKNDFLDAYRFLEEFAMKKCK